LAVIANSEFVNGIYVLPGNGDGTFGAPVFTAVEATPTPMTVADFNGDGIPDLVFGGFVYLGNGDGTFRGEWLGQIGFGAVGDFNGDGKLDVAITDVLYGLEDYVSIALGNGDGTFSPGGSFFGGISPAYVQMAVGDFKGDGKPDLAVVNNNTLSNTNSFYNNITVLMNTSPTTP
jgi:hypothetical protein